VSETFFISDLHFGHKRIVDFGRKTGTVYRTGDTCEENMHNIIINWNKVVSKRDVVWVLGDVAFDQDGYEALFELKGRLKMVRGNHDNSFTTEQWLKRFETVEGLVRYKGFWLSHAPLHPAELRDKRNIHGHVHHNSIRNPMTQEYDTSYINVCCEAVGEIPFPFELIKSGEYHNVRKC
jgi:calcineurin-like phosphoesterase family protein